MAKILVVEDNAETREAVKDALVTERHNVDCAGGAMEGWDFIKTYDYDVLILDWEMPGMSGVELLHKYRLSGGKTPVIMLTGRSATQDKISGLDAGAEHYLTKPFEREELLSFIRATLRRQVEKSSDDISWGDVELRPSASEVHRNGQRVSLSSKELDVLKLLMSNASRIVSADELKKCAWSDAPDTSSGTIRTFLTGLREKLSSIGSQIQIVNVRGFGYQIKK